MTLHIIKTEVCVYVWLLLLKGEPFMSELLNCAPVGTDVLRELISTCVGHHLGLMSRGA